MTLPFSWLRFGANHNLQIVVIEPLFEEANRCRRLIAQIMRGLDAAGIGSCVADLPGTGESECEISAVQLKDWEDAVAAYAPTCVASFRGGAILDASATHRWRFAPESGARTVRDLKRATLTSADAMLYAGHALSDEFLDELEVATPYGSARAVRLESDAAEADLKVSGSPLWRRAEPGNDAGLAVALTADLSNWVRQCAAS